MGVASLTVFGAAVPEHFLSIWAHWWLGDASGALLFAPLIIAWYRDPRPRWTRRQAVEAGALLVSLVLFAELVFGGWAPEPLDRFPFLATPLLLWPAYRFGPRETTAAMLVMFALALATTLGGSGPFASSAPFAALLSMQGFLAVLALTSLAVAATNVARLRSVADLEQSQRELEGAISMLAAECKHDALTGVANRRGFAEQLRIETARSRRQATPLALLIVDVDKFRRHNQEIGHGAADEVLRGVATLLRSQIRACDHVSRFGGDEFVVLLPATDLSGARATAERCRRAVERHEWELRDVTVSIGGTAQRIEPGQPADLLELADQALFRAKAAGRNRVSVLGARKGAMARAAEEA
jgi:diguanylate cyclase (GGDEF)-like protein